MGLCAVETGVLASISAECRRFTKNKPILLVFPALIFRHWYPVSQAYILIPDSILSSMEFPRLWR